MMRVPLPVYDDVPLVTLVEKADEFVKWYLNVRPWKCVKCGTTMFGRMPYCSYCKVRLNVDTPRPDSYVEVER